MDDFEATFEVVEVPAHGHFRVALNNSGSSLGMKRNEIERYATFSGGVIRPPLAVLEEASQELRSLDSRRAGSSRTPDARRRQRALHSVSGEVVQLPILFRRSLPISNVGFIPHFPIPRLDLASAVSLYTVQHPLPDQLSPFSVILRRISPPRPEGALGPGMPVGLWIT